MNESLPAIRAFLEAQSTLALATTNADGQPETAPLFYISDEALNLYWLSSPGSRHSINLTARPRVAAAVYPAVWAWQDIRGLQIEGQARLVADERVREQMLRRYLDKFLLPASFDAQIEISGLYLLTPAWIRWLDNSVSFGHRVEISL